MQAQIKHCAQGWSVLIVIEKAQAMMCLNELS